MVPEPFSYLARRFLLAREMRRHHRCHRRGTRPVNRHCHRGWTSDLFSSQPRPELGGSGGALWTPAYTPTDRLTSWMYSTTLVQYLYISCYDKGFVVSPQLDKPTFAKVTEMFDCYLSGQ